MGEQMSVDHDQRDDLLGNEIVTMAR